ncbi:MAG: adenylyltransferase/cytidyltransferase family protein, partial [Patescibacteria group bacterium]
VFDLTHAGHVLFFEDCKALGDMLVVGIGGDESVKNYKGPARPIINEHMRVKMVSSLKPVDFCFVTSAVKINDPLYDMTNMLGSLKPDIYVVNEDAFDLPSRKQLADKSGAKLVVLKRTCPAEFDSISTTKIIEKLKGS